jgi:hypothetical protein
MIHPLTVLPVPRYFGENGSTAKSISVPPPQFVTAFRSVAAHVGPPAASGVSASVVISS